MTAKPAIPRPTDAERRADIQRQIEREDAEREAEMQAARRDRNANGHLVFRRRLTDPRSWPATMTLDDLMGRLKQANPEAHDRLIVCFHQFAASLLKPQSSGKPRTLIAKLRASHDCPKRDEPGFIQQPPKFGVHRWRCDACDAIVRLPKVEH
jgi:hypothetical protein